MGERRAASQRATAMRVLTALLCVLLFSLLCSLGFWQLSRAEQKRDRFERFTERYQAEAVDLDLIQTRAPIEDLLWRRVRIQGNYLDSQVLLDNRIRGGVAGYEVLTPMRSSAGRHILVNRGWIPLGSRRDDVPTLELPSDLVSLSGYLGPPPVGGIELEDERRALEQLGAGIFRVQHAGLAQLSSVLALELVPAVVYIDAEVSGALTTNWPPPGDGSSKHRAYAVQWFAMAAVLVIICAFNLRATRAKQHE